MPFSASRRAGVSLRPTGESLFRLTTCATSSIHRIKGSRIVTDQEKQKAEEMISRLETAVGQLFPRDGGNASLISGMIQSLNGLRSLLGLVRPH
jgi:hypothetical protein